MSVKSVTVRVPAKVNLQLSVGPREADGFHNLVTVFQAISIFDDVTVTFGPQRAGLVSQLLVIKDMEFRQMIVIWPSRRLL